jgi:hypothetical protein
VLGSRVMFLNMMRLRRGVMHLRRGVMHLRCGAPCLLGTGLRLPRGHCRPMRFLVPLRRGVCFGGSRRCTTSRRAVLRLAPRCGGGVIFDPLGLAGRRGGRPAWPAPGTSPRRPASAAPTRRSTALAFDLVAPASDLAAPASDLAAPASDLAAPAGRSAGWFSDSPGRMAGPGAAARAGRATLKRRASARFKPGVCADGLTGRRPSTGWAWARTDAGSGRSMPRSGTPRCMAPAGMTMAARAFA